MLLKRFYSLILKMIECLFGIDYSKKFDTKIRYHKSLNLKNPQTLSEKISYIELHNRTKLMSDCTDKYKVREYVTSKGLGEHLVPLVGGPWKKVEDIDFHKLPDRFVIKATHGCKMNYIVNNKSNLDNNDCIRTLKKWLRTTYGTYSVEPHYIDIEHQLIAEKFLDNADKMVDYKIHCLNGKPEFILVFYDRVVNGDAPMQVKMNLYDEKWEALDELVASNMEIPGNQTFNKPDNFGKMLDIARKLSRDFDFVRVDLYEIEGKVYFGELTFTPACCVLPYLSENFDLKMGEKLIING